MRLLAIDPSLTATGFAVVELSGDAENVLRLDFVATKPDTKSRHVYQADKDGARVDDIVRGGETTFVKLSRPIPVHIVYMTAWVDEAGQPNFRNDVYDLDPNVSIPANLRAPTLVAGQSGSEAGSPTLRQGSMK